MMMSETLVDNRQGKSNILNSIPENATKLIQMIW